ncbi:MAG: hypothetical protein ACYC7B_10415 [Burkholderiales bacterium]
MTPFIAAVPDFVMFPLARGELAVGRTRTFCQVREFFTLLLVEDVTVKVSAVAVTLVIATEVPDATPLMFLALFPKPEVRVISTVGAVPPMSKLNPAGASSTMVPVPTLAVAVSA